MRCSAPPAVGEGSGNGKVILLGEHAVVHGVTAIAAGLGRGVVASVCPSCSPVSTLHVRDAKGPWAIAQDAELVQAFRVLCEQVGIEQPLEAVVRITLPTRAGLGSSAAMGVALARALLESRGLPRTVERVEKAAQAWEKVFHGNPSGIDVAAAIHGGCIAFTRGKGATPLPLARPLALCVGDTGERSSTREMVARVTALLESRADRGRAMLDGIRAAVEAGCEALAQGDLQSLGRAMNANGASLAQLGLATRRSDTLVDLALGAGALGAKVTGAGGGGCVVALVTGAQDGVVDAWKRGGFDGFAVDVSPL